MRWSTLTPRCATSFGVIANLLLACVCQATSLSIRRVHVVVNPASGGRVGLNTLETVVPIFEAAGIECTTLLTSYAGHAREYAATVDLQDAFLAIGGDGTAHEVANGMLSRPLEQRVPLGIIPAGSGNSWSCDLGLADAEAAARAVVDGSTVLVDVMRVDLAQASSETSSQAPPETSSDLSNAFALNICAWGLPAAVLTAANELRKSFGSAQYDLAGLLLILQGRSTFAATLEYVDAAGVTVCRECADVSFVQGQINERMGKRVRFAPGALMQDGLIDLVLISSGSGAAIVASQALAQYADGAHTALPFVEVIRCQSFQVTPSASSSRTEGSAAGAACDMMDVNLDGELLSGCAPFRATCLQRELLVFGTSPDNTPTV